MSICSTLLNSLQDQPDLVLLETGHTLFQSTNDPIIICSTELNYNEAFKSVIMKFCSSQSSEFS